jgi:hypothetical protein
MRYPKPKEILSMILGLYRTSPASYYRQHLIDEATCFRDLGQIQDHATGGP